MGRRHSDFRRDSATALEGLAHTPLPSKVELLVNQEAEQGLLGALLLDNRVFDRVGDVLKPEHFAVEVHGRIYQAIAGRIGRGRVASPTLMRDIFENDPDLEHLGGAGYLAELAGSVVTILNTADYARTIVGLHARRSALREMDVARQALLHPDPTEQPGATLEALTTALDALRMRETGERPPMRVGEAADAQVERIRAAREGSVLNRGVPVGLVCVDERIGGLRNGELGYVAGRPGHGKSVMLGTIARAAAEQGREVLVFSLEMPATQWAARYLAAETGVPTQAQRRGHVHDMDAMVEAAHRLHDLPITIDDRPGLSVADIIGRATRHKARHGLGLLVVDHCGLVRPADPRRTETAQAGAISNALKREGARDLDVPVWAAVQLNRGVESREDKRPTVSDMRQSGEYEQDADIIMLVFREELYLRNAAPRREQFAKEDKWIEATADWSAQLSACSNKAEIILGKFREGEPGTFAVAFDGVRQIFGDLR